MLKLTVPERLRRMKLPAASISASATTKPAYSGRSAVCRCVTGPSMIALITCGMAVAAAMATIAATHMVTTCRVYGRK